MWVVGCGLWVVVVVVNMVVNVVLRPRSKEVEGGYGSYGRSWVMCRKNRVRVDVRYYVP